MKHKPTLTQKPRTVKLPEIARYFGVHPVTARRMCRRWAKNGPLPIKKDGNAWWVDRRDWNEFIRGRAA